MLTAQQPIVAPAGVLVSLDTTGDYPEVVVTISSDVSSLPHAFIKACHDFAGNEGAGLNFEVSGRAKTTMKKVGGVWSWEIGR